MGYCLLMSASWGHYVRFRRTLQVPAISPAPARVKGPAHRSHARRAALMGGCRWLVFRACPLAAGPQSAEEEVGHALGVVRLHDSVGHSGSETRPEGQERLLPHRMVLRLVLVEPLVGIDESQRAICKREGLVEQA